MANYRDGVVRDGSSIGSGSSIGNIKNGVIKNGSSRGSGSPLGNVKGGVIKNGSSRGSGSVILNVKNGKVRDGSSLGSGSIVGKVKDFKIKGADSLPEDEVVALYNLLAISGGMTARGLGLPVQHYDAGYHYSLVRDKWYGVNSNTSGGSLLDFNFDSLDLLEGNSLLDWMK